MFLSICIPSYNSGVKIERLLDSIQLQSFKDYEIIVSDDSSNDEVKSIVEQKYPDLNIKYYHNKPALGTPANWNNAVAKANGEWIKLMHHDDWFLDENALQQFADHTDKEHSAKLIFCSFMNIDLDNHRSFVTKCSKLDLWLLKRNYLNLYKNFIGNPSCTLVSSILKPYEYDKRIKWLIDFDFYTWFFRKEKKFTYIAKPLIAFGLHASQVTAQTKKNPAVEIPESFLLYDKYGISILKNIFVFDFFWRMYRNLELKNIQQLESYLGFKNPYPVIASIIKMQNRVPSKALHNGFVSKLLMLITYCKNRLFR